MTAAPATRVSASPAIGWLSAVLLFVLLAAAGVPAANAHPIADQRHELGIEREASRPRVAAEAPRAGKRTAYLHRCVHAGRPELPWLGLTRHGSPPARAPTC